MKKNESVPHEFYKKGAEAELKEIVFDGVSALSKKRITKSYRNKELDLLIRTKRTRGEVKLLREASLVINTPKIFAVNEKECEIIMEFVQGKKLKELIEKKPEYCFEAGKRIRLLHDACIIHGDLTTSNIIVATETSPDLKQRLAKNGALFFIDFGLGYFSKKVEDKAVDLIVFKKTFNATHSALKNGWEKVLEGYAPNKELIDRMKAIEKRTRYH
jgi:Kae1-associated kinase Bud32